MVVSARSSVVSAASAAAAETPAPSPMSANELARTPPRSGPANKSATSPASRASTPGTGGSPSFGSPSSALLLSQAAHWPPRTVSSAVGGARMRAGLLSAASSQDAPSGNRANTPGSGSPSRKSLTSLGSHSEEYLENKKKKKEEEFRRLFVKVMDDLRDDNLTVANCAYWHLRAMDVEDMLASAQKSTKLECLYLDGNAMGSGSPSTIATVLLNPATNLTELTLMECGITSQGLKALANGLRANHTLLSLDLQSNSLTDGGKDFAGMEVLSDALDGGGEAGFSFNATLQHLNLSRNCLYDYGVELIADVIKMNHTVTEIGLNSNYVTVQGLKALIRAIQENKDNRVAEIELKGNSFDDPKGRLVSQLDSLLEQSRLRFRALNRIQLKHEKALRHMPNLNVWGKGHVHPIQNYTLRHRNLATGSDAGLFKHGGRGLSGRGGGLAFGGTREPRGR